MSNDLILEIKNKKYICKNFNCEFEISPLNPEFQNHFELIELLVDQNAQNETNITENSKANSHLNDEENSKKRNNSCDQKKDHDIEDYFLKDVNLLEWFRNNFDILTKINDEIFTLLKQIFDKRYKLYPNNVCSLSEYSTHIKNKVDMYCSGDYEMSIFILHVLYCHFDELFKYMDEIANFETMRLQDFSCFKEIIYLIGKDIKSIFKSAVNTIDKFANFKFSNVLIDRFNEFLIKSNKIKGTPVMHAALIKERKIYENYIKDIKNIKYTSNLKKWANEPSDDIIEKKYIKKDEVTKNNENAKNEIFQNDENKNYNNIENSQMSNNKNNDELKKSNNDSNNSIKNDDENENEITEKEYGNKDVHKLNIEDLVSYINEPKSKENHKKKPKKKKKSKKSNKENKETKENENINNNIKEMNNETNNFEEDLDISEFKKCIEDFTARNNNYLYPKKIEPNLSGAFINKLKMYYE